MKLITDLHTHPSMKPYNMHGYVPEDQVDMWREYQENKEYLKKIPALIRNAIKETAKYSQANLDKMIEANLGTPFFSIYPIERGMFDLSSEHRKKKVRRFLLDLILKSKHYTYLGAAVSGMPLEKVEKIMAAVLANQGINYYEKETFDEYQFIINQSKRLSPTGKKYKVVSDYQELKDIEDHHPDTIAAILTIEGGHALINVSKNDDFYTTWDELSPLKKEQMRSSVLLNVDRLKGKAIDPYAFDEKYTPFFTGLTHMFNNFLVGHAQTFSHGTLILPGTADLFDQQTNMNEGISELGFEVIEQILSRENGRRILIDIKHFSMKAREQFYQFLEQKFASDQIPIIASHVAVNGFEKNDLSRKDTNCLNMGEYFNRWSINFSNDDIRKIHRSGGLMGLVPHEGTMPGAAFKNRLKELNKKAKREEYLKLFWGNVFHIVMVIGDKTAWDIISLGTDFDGLMDPFDSYPDTTYLPQMKSDMVKHLDKAKELIVYKKNKQGRINKKEIKQLKFGYGSDEIVNKIFHSNIDDFLSKYFTEAYLKSDVLDLKDYGLKS